MRMVLMVMVLMVMVLMVMVVTPYNLFIELIANHSTNKVNNFLDYSLE